MMMRIQVGSLYDQWPGRPDDRVRPWLDDDQRRAFDDVVDIYSVEEKRKAALRAIVGTGRYESDAVTDWCGPNAVAARAEDARKAQDSIRNGKPAPEPKAVPALRAEVARLAAERPAVVAVATERLIVLERVLSAGRDNLVARVDAAVDEVRNDPDATVEQVLDLVDVLGWAVRLPRLAFTSSSAPEREEVRQARAMIAEATDKAVARVRAWLTEPEEVPA